MAWRKIIKRELEVAFAKDAQPVWMRIVKYILLAGLIYFLWGTKWLWPILSFLFVTSIAVHLWYRYQTNGWTKDYGAWKFDKNKPGSKNT